MSDALRNELEKIHGTYSFRFAGKARITRDPALLDRMIADAQDVRRRAANLSAANGAQLVADADERIALYQNEKAAVLDAQKGGPNAIRASILASQANAVFARYRRHYAGKDRGTRDLGLLGEMRGDLMDIKNAMETLTANYDTEGLRADMATVQSNLDLYNTEYAAIESARTTGTDAERSGLLANVANSQFALYREHFAGKSRVSRRPGLLERIIAELESIEEAMKGITGNETNDKNITIVRDQLGSYRNELTQIRAAKEQTNVDTLIGELGGAANEMFRAFDADFAGQQRATRDLDRLNVIVDALTDIERQMALIDRAYKDQTNASNLSIVRDSIKMFDDEYTAIKEAKGE